MDRLTQHMRPVRAHEGGDLDPVPARVEAGARIGFGADRIDAGIRAAAVRQFLNAVIDVLFQEIERLRARLAGQCQPLRHGVDRQNPLGAQQEATADCHLPDRPAAPDRDRVAWLDVAEFRPHIPGRKDVRKKQHLFVGELVRNFYRPDIGERHP